MIKEEHTPYKFLICKRQVMTKKALNISINKISPNDLYN